MAKPRKRIIRGLDPEYLLALKPKRGKLPTHFLTDRDAHPDEAATTSQLSRAKHWNEGSGPRQFLKRHPKLKAKFVPFRYFALAVAPGKHVKA